MIKALLGVLLLLPAAAEDKTFTVSGTVKLDGPVPPAKLNKAVLDDPNCAKLHPNPPPAQNLVVAEDGGVRWAFVYIKAGFGDREFPVPSQPVVIEQKGCEYSPRTFGIRPGQPLDIVNKDPMLHNVHGLPMRGGEFNRAQPVQGQVDRFTFKQPEVPALVKCDVHPWMRAWACVVDNPFFAVTDEKGTFEIKNLPPGDYTLGVWHEGLSTLGGTNEVRITVNANATVNFLMKKK